MFTTTVRPECFLIDCDAMTLNGMDVLLQGETPGWSVPDGKEKPTPESDTYKFGLLAVRLFARNQTSTHPTALAGISSALSSLARASLHRDPSLRPTRPPPVHRETKT